MQLNQLLVAVTLAIGITSGHGIGHDKPGKPTPEPTSLPEHDVPIDNNTVIDTHSHIIPDFLRQAMLDNGFTLSPDDSILSNGVYIPPWTLDGHLNAMNQYGINYSVVSISAPGLIFLDKKPREQLKLTRKLNDYMYSLTKQYPTRFGAFCFLPIPQVKASIEEAKYCLDKLGFEGVGLLTNYNELMVGDKLFEPIFEFLNKRNVPLYIHPASVVAECWEKTTHGYGPAMIDFPIQSTRTLIHLFASGMRSKFPDFNIIFSHGGGVLPFIADRVGNFLSTPQNGGYNSTEMFEQFRAYYYDLASAVSKPTMAAIKEFISTDRLLVGSDYPFTPGPAAAGFVRGAIANGKLTPEEQLGYKNGNALRILPGIKAKLLGRRLFRVD
ncbi:amidohydrolase 2 [Ascobolus immersus RN42]|uniref:Amidohydrolase 2 n=1 Tax=Ascobolus immersus RN42 TaxID=1160509 RepID=A0A3N4I5Z1_ASCIM|nr:amidohydrolase 2 [Ascobolus immersus RN42]